MLAALISTASPRSVSSESVRNASGGTRLDHTSRRSGFRDCAVRDGRGAAGGDDPDAGQRERAARELRRPRALLEQQHGEADGERGLELQDEARQPGGHALVDAEEEQAELAGREE